MEATSDPFGIDIADPNPITATADCGAAGLVVGGGFAVNLATTPEDFALYGTITESSADDTLRYFTVSLAAGGGPPNLAGTSVTAFAYCRATA